MVLVVDVLGAYFEASDAPITVWPWHNTRDRLRLALRCVDVRSAMSANEFGRLGYSMKMVEKKKANFNDDTDVRNHSALPFYGRDRLICGREVSDIPMQLFPLPAWWPCTGSPCRRRVIDLVGTALARGSSIVRAFIVAA